MTTEVTQTEEKLRLLLRRLHAMTNSPELGKMPKKWSKPGESVPDCAVLATNMLVKKSEIIDTNPHQCETRRILTARRKSVKTGAGGLKCSTNEHCVSGEKVDVSKKCLEVSRIMPSSKQQAIRRDFDFVDKNFPVGSKETVKKMSKTCSKTKNETALGYSSTSNLDALAKIETSSSNVRSSKRPSSSVNVKLALSSEMKRGTFSTERRAKAVCSTVGVPVIPVTSSKSTALSSLPQSKICGNSIHSPTGGQKSKKDTKSYISELLPVVNRSSCNTASKIVKPQHNPLSAVRDSSKELLPPQRAPLASLLRKRGHLSSGGGMEKAQKREPQSPPRLLHLESACNLGSSALKRPLKSTDSKIVKPQQTPLSALRDISKELLLSQRAPLASLLRRRGHLSSGGGMEKAQKQQPQSPPGLPHLESACNLGSSVLKRPLKLSDSELPMGSLPSDSNNVTETVLLNNFSPVKLNTTVSQGEKTKTPVHQGYQQCDRLPLAPAITPSNEDFEMMIIDGENIDKQHYENGDQFHDMFIYVIVDTNILIHGLDLVDQLKNNFCGPSAFKIKVVIPWVVVQELDGLKNSRSESCRNAASRAIKYLHSHLVSCHPRIQGQTVLEASVDVGLPLECSDDRILQCCLQYKRKATRGHVILITNDVNLCNKALINNVEVHTEEKILKAVIQYQNTSEKIIQEHNLSQPGYTTVGEKYQPYQPLSNVHQGTNQCKNLTLCAIFKAVQTVLVTSLSHVLQLEMEDAYGDLWLKIVVKQPPWSLSDLFVCIKKHWIAVFHYLKRGSHENFLDLHQTFVTIRDGVLIPEVVEKIVLKSLQLFMDLELRPMHRNYLREFISQLRNLVIALKGDTDQASIAGDICLPSDVEEMCRLSQCNSNTNVENVLHTFQVVWDSINNFSGAILDSIGSSHTLSYIRPTTLPSPLESLNFISRLYPAITHLRMLLSRVLEQVGKNDYEDLKFVSELCKSLFRFLPDLGVVSEVDHSMIIQPDILLKFLEESNKRELVKNGLLQLNEFCLYLYQALSQMKRT